MSRWSADRHCWSGLGSGLVPSWQRGLRVIARAVGETTLHPSLSGHAGWREVAASAIERRARALLLIGHSNGVHAITSIAAALEPHAIPCWLIALDCTLKPCPSLGANVPVALDIWAGLRRLEPGPRFRGELRRLDLPRASHVGLPDHPRARAAAIALGRDFARLHPVDAAAPGEAPGTVTTA